MQEITLGKIKIGDNHSFKIIVDGCQNHMRSVSRAKEMCQAAKEYGADIIKWQLNIAEEEMVRDEAIAASKDILTKVGSIWHYVEKYAMPVEGIYEIKKYCDEIGIEFLCTPFSLKAAEILNQMGVHSFKIGSGETEDMLMIEEIAKMKKPMLVSTGMTDMEDVDLTVSAIKSIGAPLALLHCMSIYDSLKTDRFQFGVIKALKERYNVPVGLSDHTPPDGFKDVLGRHIGQESLIWGAVAGGACFIEKHFTLDRKQDDADSCFSLDPHALQELRNQVRAAESAMGKERKVFDEEKSVAIWAKRSVVAKVNISAGTEITREMINSKRPGTGIRSKDYRKILGRQAKNNLPAGQLIKWEDLK